MAAPRAKRTTSPKLTIKLLGRFEVLRDGKPIPEEAWGRRKTKTLLKVLLTDPGRVFTQDQLIEALFEGKNPKNAVENLYGRVSELRRALQPGLKRGNESQFIIRQGQGYCFDAEGPCWTDTSEFLKYFASGAEHHKNGRHAKAIDAYEEAIRLYQGELLETDLYEEWTIESRDEWRERYINTLTQLAEDCAHLGDCHRAATACREAFNLQPWRESVLQQLMTYHQTAGERSEALQAYRQGVAALKRELDVAPSAETEALHNEILRQLPPAARAEYDKRRIAVLPMINTSPNPEDEYFADGMTEELIYTLSQVHELKVIAQTSALSYKNTRKTIAQIGRELNIGTILEGSVRKAANNVRITVQLVDVASEEHLWSQEYDRPLRDIFSIQSDIAQQVTGALRMRLTGTLAQRMGEEPTANLDAYISYLKGRHFMAKRTLGDIEKAGECFKRAIELDPNYALAYAGLAQHYMLLASYRPLKPKTAFPLAKAAAEKALEIDDSCAEALTTLAWLRFHQDRDPAAAEREYKHVISLHPNSAEAHRRYSMQLRDLARFDEAIEEIKKALELDPVSLVANATLGSALRQARLYDEAIEVLRETIELDPSFSVAHLILGQCYYGKGMYEEALAEMEKAKTFPPSQLMPRIGVVYAAMGRKDRAREILDESIEDLKHGYVSLVPLTCLCFALGETDQGFRYLEEAYEEADVLLCGLKVSLLYDCVRSDPRFTSLLKGMGLGG